MAIGQREGFDLRALPPIPAAQLNHWWADSPPDWINLVHRTVSKARERSAQGP